MSRAPLLIGLCVASALSAGAGLLLDMDGDRRSNWEEITAGTSGLRMDTDRDGLGDGDEYLAGLDPLDADMDGDGVLDGHEGARSCIRDTDCDQDGLSDGDEVGGFDPLDPDSYDVGLSDGVIATYEAAGQPGSPDADMDGIPDGWETDDGLIAWAPFSPEAGSTDLMVEFLRVEGPDSGRFNLDFEPAYEAVAQMFAQQGIRLNWIETVVERDAEHRPDFLTEDAIGYYDDVLRAGTASQNPFVTTIVLNPQQTQEDLAGHILGAAFLRSMIATVDYGAHAVVSFEEDHANGLTLNGNTISLRPVLESHIVGARYEQVRQLRFSDEGVVDMGVLSGGDLHLRTRDSGTTFDWRWTPDWYATAPNITIADDPDTYLQLRIDDVELLTDEMAATIAHELGHTLGLCHAHEEDCYVQFRPSEINQASIDSTTMSYTAPADALHFLASEWDQVREYLACPPQEPVVLRAVDADEDVFLDAKYYASFVEERDLRACGDAEPVRADLPAPIAASTARDGAPWLAGHIGMSVVGLGLIAWLFRPS